MTTVRQRQNSGARLSLLAALALSLAACQPPGPVGDTATVAIADPADQGCAASAKAVWIDQETPLRRYTAEARTFGPTCEAAAAVLVVRAREGSPVLVWAGAVQHLFGLKDANDPAAMTSALAEWIDQSGSIYPTSDRLPEWPAGADAPEAGEFPFYPEDGIDWSYWEELRRSASDVFCFPQGMESTRCAVLRDGQLEMIGVQTFPG